MCKITIVTKHFPSDLKDLIFDSWTIMSRTEKDGFGASWVMPNGKIAYVKSSTPNLFNSKIPDFIEGFYHLEGEFVSDGSALIIHGRTATCDKNITNTHPMLSGCSALIHNGIVESDTYKNIKTSCDSELLLNAFKHDGIKAVEKHISGYYAFAVITAKKNDVQLDIVRDSTASLFCGETKDNGWAFATTHELLRVCNVNIVSEFKKNTHVKFINGIFIYTNKIKPLKTNYDYTLERKKQKAFGHSYYQEYKRRSNNLEPELINESNDYTNQKQIAF
jgi:asparagine synthetase B (glutamine-hydrolysing)